MIFSRRWYGIKGETIEPGSPHQMSVVRIQTTKDGAWQALTEKELDQLVVEHNQFVSFREQTDKSAKPAPKTKVIEKATARKVRKTAGKKKK